jgi:hypothetical protein
MLQQWVGYTKVMWMKQKTYHFILQPANIPKSSWRLIVAYTPSTSAAQTIM